MSEKFRPKAFYTDMDKLSDHRSGGSFRVVSVSDYNHMILRKNTEIIYLKEKLIASGVDLNILENEIDKKVSEIRYINDDVIK